MNINDVSENIVRQTSKTVKHVGNANSNADNDSENDEDDDEEKTNKEFKSFWCTKHLIRKTKLK